MVKNSICFVVIIMLIRIGLSSVTSASLQIQGESDIIFNTATDTERLKINATGLDVAGIIDNTRDNGNISAPNNSDHTAGTRIKFFDNGADVGMRLV